VLQVIGWPAQIEKCFNCGEVAEAYVNDEPVFPDDPKALCIKCLKESGLVGFYELKPQLPEGWQIIK